MLADVIAHVSLVDVVLVLAACALVVFIVKSVRR
jgi:hypothetical protein